MTHTLPPEFTRAAEPWSATLDGIVAGACKLMFDSHSDEWSRFEIIEGYQELQRLASKQDLAYDRPSIGAHYAWWYHLQRTNELIRVLAPRLLGRAGRVSLVDIGSGTGSAAWAVTVTSAAAAHSGIDHPEVHIHGLDVSPFMIEASRCLWEAFQAAPFWDSASVTAEFTLGNWADPSAPLPTGSPSHAVIASYLFDASDVEHMGELAERFDLMCNSKGYREAIVVTAASKRHLAAELDETMGKSFEVTKVSLPPPLWRGRIDKCADSRTRFLTGLGVVSRYEPTWTNREPLTSSYTSMDGTVLAVPQATLTYDEAQDRAAEPRERLTAIIGAAGSGKSRVLCERVARLIERAGPAESPDVLVTSFNKDMIDLLSEWLESRLRASDAVPSFEFHRKEAGVWEFYVRTARGSEGMVTLINRDKLPRRVFGIDAVPIDANWSSFVNNRYWSLKRSSDPVADRVIPKFSAPFLQAEYERIILGEGPLERDVYVNPAFKRRGRGKGLPVEDRADVWDFLMTDHLPGHFITERLMAVRRHAPAVSEAQPVSPPLRFTHVFVDESQDFTPAEIQLLARIPPNPRRLCIAGDETQSIHLGASYRRPGIVGAQWDIHLLGGSYRLPARVCEAVAPLAAAIGSDHLSKESGGDGAVPEVRKSATPGPRPVVVSGDRGPDHVCESVVRLSRYVPNNALVTVTQGDRPASDRASLAAARLKDRGFRIEMGSMLKIKGLERQFVVFPSDSVASGDESAAEWVYTCLTRSTGVIMVVLYEATPTETAKALALLDSDRLLFWDEDARAVFESIIRQRPYNQGDVAAG